uniref:F-box domain-containing protein n=1 Tax=Kalanchoe fedtschenkoi TaxID=63787 RepID=A0A7N0TFZ4_KALFE
MELLPEDCMRHIFSFASPLEACRMCGVSSAVQSTVDSDAVWEKFLPPDYTEIVSRLVWPVEFSSKKELFFKLSSPLLIDHGMKMFWLDKKSGKKCYMLGARALSIAWADSPLYWSWKPLLGSRFPEVAELRTIWWLEIQGCLESSALSPDTTYRVYLIVQFANRTYGLDKLPSEMIIEAGKHKLETTIYLRSHNIERSKEPDAEHVRNSNNATKVLRRRNHEEQKPNPCAREDGWMEIELGEFYNNGDDIQQVKMSLREVKGVHLKGGLIVEGMEIRAQESKYEK